jgi:secernin
MCDTFVAVGEATSDGSVILGKNTDREPNEAHEVVIFPAQDHAPGSMVQCTYIQVPQVAHTYSVLLAKPFWIWGAEMGVNEHGVAIGNEAIFTKVPYDKDPGLIGMDFIRLALERAKTAFEALQVITQLLEKHGQGGSCGFTHPFYYHNSYILADPKEAWVLETAGQQWVAEKVKSTRSISNAASIGSEWDLASADLVRYAVERGWCKSREDFHFARCYSDVLYTTLSDARPRAACTSGLLSASRGSITVKSAMQVLRSHGEKSAEKLRLDKSLLGASVCMHAGAGPVRESQSVGSMVAHLSGRLNTAWVTATSAPCLSIFKPVWLDSGYPLSEPSPTGEFNPDCLWWRHEELHRAVLKDYAGLSSLFMAERNDLEEQFLQSAAVCEDAPAERLAFSARCFQTAEARRAAWLDRVRTAPVASRNSIYYQFAWNSFGQKAKLRIV